MGTFACYCVFHPRVKTEETDERDPACENRDPAQTTIQMAKKRNNTNGRNQRRRARMPRPVRAIRARLDQAATDLAKLLDDPCGAPVVRGLAAGSGGSLVVRLELDSIFFAGATETAGALYWVPGGLRAFQNAAANDTTGISLQQVNTPGYAFLNNYSSARVVAACAQVYWPGTELNRSGIVSMGVVPAGQLTNIIPAGFGGGAGTMTVSQMRSSCQIVQRTPATMAEIKLRPGETEWRMVDLAALSADEKEFPEQASGKNALLITAAGLPPATGIRIRMVGVFEIIPLSNQGLVASVETTRSHNTEREVVQALDETKPRWWHTPAADVAYHTLGLASVAAAGVYGGPETAAGAFAAYDFGNDLRNRGRR